MGSGTIRRCGFDGIGVALFEEVCHCLGGGVALRVPSAQALPSVEEMLLLAVY